MFAFLSSQNQSGAMSTTQTTTALQGTGGGSTNHNNLHSSSHNFNNAATLPLDDFHFSSSQLLSLLDSKDEAFQVLKSDLMDALNKEVKTLDEDSWMFEGPRSRINLMAKPGGSFAMRNIKSASQWNIGPSS